MIPVPSLSLAQRTPPTAAPGAGHAAAATTSGRVVAVDLARSMALLGMILFHGVRDLEVFGLAAPGTTLASGWAVFARLVAGSFLFLAGVSLALAHRDGIRWRAFARRLLIVGSAAALISIVTGLIAADRFVFFGILHCIAMASVVGLVFLRAPVMAVIGAAILAFVLPDAIRGISGGNPWLLWLGPTAPVPPTLDYLPLLPWLGPFLAGLAAARLVDNVGLWPRIARWTDRGQWAWGLLAWPGRHSLSIYLLHQPVLIAVIWAVTRAMP